MSYTQYTYLFVFLVAAFILYTVFPKKAKWCVLLAFSFAFYYIGCNGSWKKVLCFFLTTFSVYATALLLSYVQRRWNIRRKDLQKEERAAAKARVVRAKKWIVVFAVLLNFGMLAFLKYYAPIRNISNSIFSQFGLVWSLPVRKIVMPLGISFYTLQAVSYVVDVYRGKYEADRNPFRVTLFLIFFPQIVEGPIGRYDQLAGQLYEGHSFDYDRFCFALQLIVWGLFKKIVIADRADKLVGTVFDSSETYFGLSVLLASVLYTVQIYMEFSGCMDIVAGSAELFGVSLAKNFKRPFFSVSVSEFWRRWHITLGTWLRDYVLYPVTLSRPMQHFSRFVKRHFNSYFAKFVPTAISLFCVWICMGIWHGVGWKYVIYGMYYYIIMLVGMLAEPIFKRACGGLHIRRESKGFHIFRILRTCVLVSTGMLIFRADSTGSAWNMLCAIFSGFSLQSLTDGSLLKLGCDGKDLIVILLGCLIVFVASLLQEKGHALRTELAAKPLPLRWAVYLTGILVLVVFGAYGDGYGTVDFIYAGF